MKHAIMILASAITFGIMGLLAAWGATRNIQASPYPSSDFAPTIFLFFTVGGVCLGVIVGYLSGYLGNRLAK